MGYLSALSIGAFNRKAGRLIYYPWGIFGSGYEVQSWTARRRLAAFGRFSLPLYLFVAVSAALLAGLVGLVLALLCIGLIHAGLIGRFVRHMPRSPERLGFRENLRNQVQERSLIALCSAEFALLALATFGAWFTAGSGSLGGASILLIVLVLPILLLFGLMIREKLRL